MDDRLRAMQEALIRRHLGKHGIHGLKVDEQSNTVEMYVDETADLERAVRCVQKDIGDMQLRAQKSRRARLA